MNCKINTNAVIGSPDEPTFSDAEISGLLKHEQDILIRPIHLLSGFPTKSFDSRFGGLRSCHP